MRNALTQIESQLAPGERLVWAGQPRRGLQFDSKDAFIIPFGLAWMVFAIFWILTATEAPRGADVPFLSIVFPLVGLPFFLLGLYLCIGRFWLDSRRRLRTAYGITDRRLITVEDGKLKRMLALDALSRISVRKQKDGSGSIRIDGKPGDGSAPIRWTQLPNVAEVEGLLNRSRASRAPA